jgi:hypothetical protein
MVELHIRLTFTEELLGTCSGNPELHSQFIASKSADADKAAEELAALPAIELEEQSKTVFPRTQNGTPFIWDYQLKGFFKDACLALMESDNTCVSTVEEQKKLGLTKYMNKRTIDNQLFITPRRCELAIPAGGVIGQCQRPLRAMTMRGERIALAHSETVPIGTTLSATITLLNARLETFVREALMFGRLKGLGQWRNSGKGRFSAVVE